jgi:hypothetical protein
MQRAFAVAAERLAAFARGDEPPNLVVDAYENYAPLVSEPLMQRLREAAAERSEGVR